MSLDTATILCGIECTLNAGLYFFGIFFSQSVRDLEGCIRTLDGVLREIVGFWTSTILQSMSLLNIEVDAAQSRYAVVLFKVGGLAQPGGSF